MKSNRVPDTSSLPAHHPAVRPGPEGVPPTGDTAPQQGGLVASNAPPIDASADVLQQAVGSDIAMRDPASPSALRETDGPIAAGGLEISKQDDGSIIIRRVDASTAADDVSLGLRGVKLSGNAAAYIADPRVTVFVMFSGAPVQADVPTVTAADLERPVEQAAAAEDAGPEQTA